MLCSVGFIAAAALVPQPPVPRAHSTLGRAALLRTASSALASTAFSGALAANAFDLPPLEQFEDPRLRLQYATKPNPPLTKQASSAFYAVTVGDIRTLQAMVDGGWDLDKATDTAGKTTLHRAAQVGSVPAIKILLDAGVKVDPTTRWEETPLHMAVRNGRLAAVKQLVAAGASLSDATFAGDAALDIARKYRMSSIIDFLSSPQG